MNNPVLWLIIGGAILWYFNQQSSAVSQPPVQTGPLTPAQTAALTTWVDQNVSNPTHIVSAPPSIIANTVPAVNWAVSGYIPGVLQPVTVQRAYPSGAAAASSDVVAGMTFGEMYQRLANWGDRTLLPAAWGSLALGIAMDVNRAFGNLMTPADLFQSPDMPLTLDQFWVPYSQFVASKRALVMPGMAGWRT